MNKLTEEAEVTKTNAQEIEYRLEARERRLYELIFGMKWLWGEGKHNTAYLDQDAAGEIDEEVEW